MKKYEQILEEIALLQTIIENDKRNLAALFSRREHIDSRIILDTSSWILIREAQIKALKWVIMESGVQ